MSISSETFRDALSTVFRPTLADYRMRALAGLREKEQDLQRINTVRAMVALNVLNSMKVFDFVVSDEDSDDDPSMPFVGEFVESNAVFLKKEDTPEFEDSEILHYAMASILIASCQAIIEILGKSKNELALIVPDVKDELSVALGIQEQVQNIEVHTMQ